MARKPTASPRDVVSYLTEQHDAIRAQFTATLNAKSAKSQHAAFTRLRTLLAVHETAEAMMVHPRVRRKIDGGATIADARLTEEHAVRIALRELEKTPCGTAEFTNRLTRLQAMILAHAEREERDEFPLLTEHLAGDELAMLTSAVQLAERITPTEVPVGAESGFVSFAAGPFTSILDRARDLLRSRA